MNNRSGQSLLEFVFGAALSAVALTGAAVLFNAQWNRLRCAHQVFEATHSRLVDGRSRPGRVVLTEDLNSVGGEAKCGKAYEKLELLRLESTGW